jgi:LAS superfamily LD-carboxypeptidase LdcB
MATVTGLRADVRSGLARLLALLRYAGYSATYTSGYRSPAKQRQLYSAWLAGKSPYPVARPGTSRHEQGLAVDVASNAPDQVLRDAGEWAGLRWFGPRDRVHFSVDGR